MQIMNVKVEPAGTQKKRYFKNGNTRTRSLQKAHNTFAVQLFSNEEKANSKMEHMGVGVAQWYVVCYLF